MNALKSLFSSIHNDKAIKQLQALGIEMYKVDEQGQKHFRNLHDVFVDLMITSHTTSQNMEKDLLAISGGKFQWSKVASVLGSYQDFIHAYGMSINSANFSEKQIEAQLDTISRKMEQLKATLTGIATGIGASGLSAYIKNIIASLNGFAQAIQRIPTQTYEMIGAFVKWGAIIGSSIAIIRTLVKGIYGIRAAYLIATTAQAANTASTTVNTLAKAKNYALSLLGINAARTQAAASVMAAGGLTAEAVAATEASVATGGFAATVTAATGGLNLILAAIAAAVVAFLGYNTVVGTAIKETDNLTQKQADAITAQEQNIQNLEAQKEFIGTLCEAHVKLQEALDTSKEGTEQHTKAEEDLKATDKELAEIIGADAASNIDWSRNVQDVIKDEQTVFTNKINNEKQKLAEAKLAQLQYTQNQITWTKNRIEALKSEGYGWDALKEVIEKFLHFFGGAMVLMGENLRNLQDSIMQTPILGKIARAAGFGENELGGFVRGGFNKLISAGQNLQSYNASSLVDSFKNIPMIGDITQLGIDHFYDTSGFFSSHSNRKNELKYQEDDLKRLEKELNDQKIAYYRQRVDNAKDNDSGTIRDDDAGSKNKGSKGKGNKGAKGAKEADNSVEAILYRFLTNDKKLSHNRAIGELANVQAMSNFDYKAGEGTDRRGLYGWNQKQWAEYEKWLAGTGYKDSAVSQINYKHTWAEKYDKEEKEKYQAYLREGSSTPQEFAQAYSNNISKIGTIDTAVVNALDKRFAKKNGEENYSDPMKDMAERYALLKKEFTDTLNDLKTERAKKGEKVSAEEELKLFEKIMGIGDGKNPFAYLETAIKDYQKQLLEAAKYEAKRQEDIRKATDTQVAAIDKMADSEVAFAEKLGLMSKADVRDYYNRKNERNYATQKPILDAKLASTVALDRGTADDMMSAYQGLIYAKDRAEAEWYAKKLMWLSRDIDATKKALDEEMKLEESYQNKRQELAREAYEHDARYAIQFVDSFSSAFQSGLESILNGTKTFGDALKDMFKSIVNDIIKLFAEDMAKKVKGWLSKIFHRTGEDSPIGVNPSAVPGGEKKAGSKSDNIGGLFDSFNTLGIFGRTKDVGIGGGKNGKGGGGLFGGFSIIDSLIPQNTVQQVRQQMNQIKGTMTGALSGTYNAMSNISQTGMNGISNAVQTGTAMMSTEWGTYKAAQVTTEQTGNAAITASSTTTAATVQASTAAMMGWLMAVLALFSLFGGFGGGGSSETKTTTSTNLGRSPDTYYMTPTPVMQSTTFNVPSFDIGGNIEQDMFAMVHKGEMVLTPEQADVIRNTARTGGVDGVMGGSNANIKSNIQVSTVDSRGFEKVLKDYNRQLSKNVKRGVRNGYLTAKGLV